MSVTNLWDRHIGNLPVYKNQVICAQRIIETFDRYDATPLLVAGPQQGKTGVCVAVVDQFLANARMHNLKTEVIHLIHLADNTVRDQTIHRYRLAGLLNQVRVLHHGDLRNGGTNPDYSADRRLLIDDEGHIALARSTSEKERPLHEFYKKCGIAYGFPISQWTNKHNSVLASSATPYAQVIQHLLVANTFTPIVLEQDEFYFSLLNLYNATRLFQALPMVAGVEVTRFFVNRITVFKYHCKKFGNGILVVRTHGRYAEIIKDYLRQNQPDVDVQEFSDGLGNISNLDHVLSQQYPRPLIAIIRGSLRAGKTLTTTKYIRGWIDSPEARGDTMVQSVGRSLGYEMVGGMNRKFEDVYPVYCDMREVKTAIEFYSSFNHIPTGVRNKSTTTRQSRNFGVAKWEDIPEKYKTTNKGGQPAATAVSASGARDGVPVDLLRNIHNGDATTRAGTNTPHIHIDGPNKHFVDSWNQAITKHPEWASGEYYTYRLDDAALPKVNLSDKIDPTCIFAAGDHLHENF